jgi:phenylacetate-CoA ligase
MDARTLAGSLYARLPVALQNAAFTAWGLKLRHERYGREFRERLAWLRESQWWPAERVAAYQAAQVRAMVADAYEHVPFYRERMRRTGVRPSDVQSAEDLPRLPLLAKAEVRAHAAALVSTRFSPARLRTALTSGTTGTPLRVRLTPAAMQFQWAVWWRHRARFGLAPGDRFLTFGARLPVPAAAARPPFWRENRAIGQVYLSTYHLTPANLVAVVEWLNTQEFAFYTGYPSAMHVLASFVRREGMTLARPPRWVVSGSDALLPGFERVIGETFGAPVTDQYGSVEACGNFARCEHGRYHLDAEFGAVELLPVAGAEGTRLRRLVFTGFANPAMPFLRYDIGDYGVVSEGPCPCGRETLSLDRVEGRTEDYVRTPDGRMAIGMNQVFEWAPGIVEGQIRQDRLDEIVVLVVPGPGYGPSDQAILLRELRGRLGQEIRIAFECVDHIPRAASGKFRAVVSTLPPASPEEAEHRRAVAGPLSP